MKYESIPLRFDRANIAIESRPPAGFTVTCRACGKVETNPGTRNQVFCNEHISTKRRGRRA